MKRLVLATVLLLGGTLGAHADNDTYTNTRARPSAAMMYCTPMSIRARGASAAPGTASRPRAPSSAA